MARKRVISHKLRDNWDIVRKAILVNNFSGNAEEWWSKYENIEPLLSWKLFHIQVHNHYGFDLATKCSLRCLSWNALRYALTVYSRQGTNVHRTHSAELDCHSLVTEGAFPQLQKCIVRVNWRMVRYVLRQVSTRISWSRWSFQEKVRWTSGLFRHLITMLD